MILKDLVTGLSGEKHFLLGNEAAVRGAIEAGVTIAATYPGTPSSEIGNILSELAKDANIYFEFSSNEKVAMEVAATAAVSGLRSFTFMKHVGMNVASDSFMTTAYSGVKKGMVILVADDPSSFSSQNEQDTRHYGRLSNIPVLEPSSCQEIKDMVKYGFDLSEQFNVPVIVRTTTRTSHMRGIVEFGDIIERDLDEEGNWKKGYFNKNPAQYVPVPANAVDMHFELCKKMEKAEEIASKSEFNKETLVDGAEYGVISSSSAYNYAKDVIRKFDLKINLLGLGFSHPFPTELVKNFLKDLKGVFIVEEVEPIVEKEVLSIIGKEKLNIDVYGKLDKIFPRVHEFNPDIVRDGFNKILNFKEESYTPKLSNNLNDLINNIPGRAPVLCAGCPHRAMYYAAIKAAEESKIPKEDIIYASDIGCYTLGISPPFETADYLLSMGSSVGDGCGFSKATNQQVVSFIGDSTFFHSGISPLVNAVHNKHNFVLTVLDNRITAMTGGQPNPGMPIDGMGDKAPEISIRAIAVACGCDFVRVINPLNVKQAIETYKQAFKRKGTSVIVAKYPCTLIKGLAKKPPVKFNQDKCNHCYKCHNELACPAISLENNNIVIDEAMCDGCSLCVQVCKYGALESR